MPHTDTDTDTHTHSHTHTHSPPPHTQTTDHIPARPNFKLNVSLVSSHSAPPLTPPYTPFPPLTQGRGVFTMPSGALVEGEWEGGVLRGAATLRGAASGSELYVGELAEVAGCRGELEPHGEGRGSTTLADGTAATSNPNLSPNPKPNPNPNLSPNPNPNPNPNQAPPSPS